MPSIPYFTQALEALRAGDRRGAAALLAKQLTPGNTSPKNLASVAQLAGHIGEADLAIEAARQAVVPGSISSRLGWWSALATFGRTQEAVADLERQPSAVQNNPHVVHFRATVASQVGRAEEAEQLFRQSLAAIPESLPTWFSLAMIKTFVPGDPDIAAMERLESLHAAPPEARASLMHGLGKAWEDIGDVDRAFDYYRKGAAISFGARPVDLTGLLRAADRTVTEYGPDFAERLAPSTFEGQRSLFVTGMPRSGTTLTEQILLSHSNVLDGAELNLFGAALLPAGGTLATAVAYQEKRGSSDPWGDIARDYAGLVDRHFRSSSLIVDKSLNQGLMVGLMLHAMPDAKIAWLRRNPGDVALSCFATYFAGGLPWTNSLAAIADFMRMEDRLFDHWQQCFPEQILAVPYESLVERPGEWALKLQRHFDLQTEAGLEQISRKGRAVRTASVGQVHDRITTRRIGRAEAFARHLKPFYDRYDG
ncbi:sulfotransferase [Sphingomonas sp. ASV193]|uniref:tetratricopeptide repeat-containing sulfotransferase family protein n=1 Tax=Sphingomonas sp. ASV193 TaxID=3144405 RepID=UPI0032E8B74C